MKRFYTFDGEAVKTKKPKVDTVEKYGVFLDALENDVEEETMPMKITINLDNIVAYRESIDSKLCIPTGTIIYTSIGETFWVKNTLKEINQIMKDN